MYYRKVILFPLVSGFPRVFSLTTVVELFLRALESAVFFKCFEPTVIFCCWGLRMCFWRFWVWKEVHALGDKTASLTQVRTCCNHVSLGPPPPRQRAPPISSLVLPAAVPLMTAPWAPGWASMLWRSVLSSSHHGPGFPRTLHSAPARPLLGVGKGSPAKGEKFSQVECLAWCRLPHEPGARPREHGL